MALWISAKIFATIGVHAKKNPETNMAQPLQQSKYAVCIQSKGTAMFW